MGIYPRIFFPINKTLFEQKIVLLKHCFKTSHQNLNKWVRRRLNASIFILIPPIVPEIRGFRTFFILLPISRSYCPDCRPTGRGGVNIPRYSKHLTNFDSGHDIF